MFNFTKPQDPNFYSKAASYAAVIIAALIIIAKLYGWFATGSLALLSSLVDSLLDIIVSSVNLFALRYALQPADEDHRFGHGKAEDIAGLIQSAFIIGSAFYIFVEAISRITTPKVVEQPVIGMGIMVFATILTLLLVIFQKYAIKKSGSNIIKADHLHYKIDLLVNIVVIANFYIATLFDYYWIDIIIALLIAVYIIKGAFKLAKNAFDNLMDKEFDDISRQKIIEIILADKDAKGVHDLRTRYSGVKPIIQFHLELDENMTLGQAHDISDKIEHEILKLYPGGEILIHQDPIGKGSVDLQKNHILSI